jgi:hypothetical protein
LCQEARHEKPNSLSAVSKQAERVNEIVNRPVAAFLAIAAFAVPVIGQRKAPKPESPAKLELSFEVATTDDDGYPSSLRITIRNVGGVPVDMPVLKEDCSPDNGFHIWSSWTPDEFNNHGSGSAYGCGSGDQQTLGWRVRNDWLRLRPSESMTDTQRVRWDDYRKEGGGTVEYWVAYTPPSATAQEIAALTQAGYVIPTEKLETPHSSFHVH